MGKEDTEEKTNGSDQILKFKLIAKSVKYDAEINVGPGKRFLNNFLKRFIIFLIDRDTINKHQKRSSKYSFYFLQNLTFAAFLKHL